jgi:hypothetical protein
MDLWVVVGLLEDRRWVVVGLLFVGLPEGWICGWRWVVVGGGLLWLVEFVVGYGLGWQSWMPFPVILGVGFVLFCFTLLQTHNVKYFLEHFPKVQTNIGKQIFSCKSFAFTNILR